MTLARLLDRAALRFPDAPAVVDGDRRLTYRALAEGAAAVGAGLARLGVTEGDRVLIALNAGFKRPRRFVFVTEIPRTASGKILRRLLRAGQYTQDAG
jgi:acyl-CoA synthetase (AMP-forming)/AMP-acid ligase II